MIDAHEYAMQGELPPLEIAAQLWEHTWKDAHGQAWSSIVLGSEYGDDQIISTGQILCEGRKVGEFDRRITIGDSDDLIATLTIEHEHLSLFPIFQGHGIGRLWMGLCAEQYVKAGLEEVHVDTGLDGLWTWPRMGFDLMAQDMCNWLGERCEYGETIYADEMRAIISDIIKRAQEHYCEDISPDQSEAFVQQIELLRDQQQGPPRLHQLMTHKSLERSILREYCRTLQTPLRADSTQLLATLSPLPPLDELSPPSASVLDEPIRFEL